MVVEFNTERVADARPCLIFSCKDSFSSTTHLQLAGSIYKSTAPIDQAMNRFNRQILTLAAFAVVTISSSTTSQAAAPADFVVESPADGKVFKRSISYQQLHAGDQLSWVISAIRRDIAEQASELPQISMLQSQQRFALPTYHSV